MLLGLGLSRETLEVVEVGAEEAGMLVVGPADSVEEVEVLVRRARALRVVGAKGLPRGAALSGTRRNRARGARMGGGAFVRSANVP